MKTLVLDTRSGDRVSDLFVLDEKGRRQKRLRLGYVPELCFDRTAGELITVETRLGSRLRGRTTYWLKGYEASNWKLRWKQETPERPMYTGYPGRSTNVDISPCGRYVYVLQSRMLIRSVDDPAASDTFRLRAHRYDRRARLLEPGVSVIESCTVAFGHARGGPQELYFHLSCDYPSTVAFSCFGQPELEWVRMEDLPSREHSPRETCGSWLDPGSGSLFCIAGDGTIYEVTHSPANSRVLLKLDLAGGEMIPLRQIHGGAGLLFVGVSADIQFRSLSLASEIWVISVAEGRVLRRLPLPFPVLNFVSGCEGSILACVSPYERAVALVDTGNGGVIRRTEDVGVTPAEVLLVEEDR